MKLPFFTKYTDKVAAGDSFLAVIRINPKYKDNAGLHAHEYQHIKQWYTATFSAFVLYIISASLLPPLGVAVHAAALVSCLYVNGALYKLSSKYRLAMEVAAYAEQIKHAKPEKKIIEIDYYSTAISEQYNLSISYEQAKTMLLKKLK
jgi:DNA-directed RNA polymerase subunit K/omega